MFQSSPFVSLGFLLLLLGGCASRISHPDALYQAPHQKVRQQSANAFTHFIAQGKIGFSDGHTGGNASLYWEQADDNYQIRLLGPIGMGAVHIQGDPRIIHLKDPKGRILTAKKPEELLQTTLGFAIPLSGLRYWLQGNIAPGPVPKIIKVDTKGRIRQIEQQGWTIFYENYQQTGENIEFPYKLTLKNEKIRLKFIFNRWIIDPKY